MSASETTEGSDARATLDRLMADAASSAVGDRTRHIALGQGALEEAVPAWLAQERPGRIDIVVCDDHTWEAAGKRVFAALEAAGRSVRKAILDPRVGDDHLVCEDGVIAAVRTFLATSDELNPIAVGAGTINDIVKMASDQLERPYQVVPTAASMNGYTSTIAAVLSRGVKRTLPCHQPEAIFADIGVLCAAPHHLTAAGFGDLLSKPYSTSDWLLSHFVRGVPFEEGPAALLDGPFQALLEHAPQVGRAEAGGVSILMETLLISGFSMALAGSSAPASGGEHLVSHYWDMEQHCQEGPLVALHGTQVGVATRLSAHLFERLIALEADAIAPDACAARRPDDAWLADLETMHPQLTANVVDEVRDQLRIKQRHGDALRSELADLKARWPEVRQALAASLMPAARIEQALVEAGCADRASSIGVERERAVHTLRVCRHIRSRYVALDLLDDLGLLHDWAADVIDAVEAA